MDTDYLRLCRETARHAARVLGWQTVSCADRDGNLRTMEDISREVDGLIRPYLA